MLLSPLFRFVAAPREYDAFKLPYRYAYWAQNSICGSPAFVSKSASAGKRGRAPNPAVGCQWKDQNSTHADCSRIKFCRAFCRHRMKRAEALAMLSQISGTRPVGVQCSNFKSLAVGRWNSVASCAISREIGGSSKESECRKNGLFVELRALGEPERRAYQNGSSMRFARRSFRCWPMAKCRFPN